MNMDTILGHLGSAALVSIPFLLVYALVIREIRRKRDQQAALGAIAAELEALREKVQLITTKDIPGGAVAKELGPVVAEGSAGAGFLGIAEKRAMILLMKRALALGANAVIDIRHERGTLQAGIVKLAGRAVRLSDPGKQNPSL
jgi:uncharacterized protein YbjQ (UPF0145 family)